MAPASVTPTSAPLQLLLVLSLTPLIACEAPAEEHTQVLLKALPPQAVAFDRGSFARVNFSAGGRMRTDFRTDLGQELSLVYSTTEGHCLLYFYEDADALTALYLANGSLVLHTEDPASGRRVQVMHAGTVSHLRSFADGVPTQLELTLHRGFLVVYLGNRRCGTFETGGAKLFGVGVASMGHLASAGDRLSAPVVDFVGRLYSLRFCEADTWSPDLVTLLRDGDDSDAGLRLGGLRLVPTPAAGAPDASERWSTDVSSPFSVTFFGDAGLARVGVTRGDARYWDWDQEGQQSVLEFALQTYDPIGVLLFKGTQLDSYSYVCAEVFDGVLYVRYNPGQRGLHQSVEACAGRRVNDGLPHRVVLAVDSFRNSADDAQYVRLRVECDGKPDAVVRERYWSPLGGYLYVGGVDSLDRLPWYVWSRRHYSGAFVYFRINGQPVDFHDFFSRKQPQPGEPAVAGRVVLLDACNATGVGVCHQSEGGRCWVDRARITGGRKMLCDCSHLALDANSCAYDYYESSFGAGRDALSLLLSPTWTTHCDDIAISFRVLRPRSTNNASSTADTIVSASSQAHGLHADELELTDSSPDPVEQQTLFMITNERKDQHMHLRVVGSVLELEVMTDAFGAGQGSTPVRALLSLALPDDHANWHSVKIQRRAGFLRIFCDEVMRGEERIAAEGFLVELTRIHTGCLPDATGVRCDNATQFTGEIRNFVVNRLDVLASASSLWSRPTAQKVSVVSSYRAAELTLNLVQVWLGDHDHDSDRDAGSDVSRVYESNSAGASSTAGTLANRMPRDSHFTDVIGLFGHHTSLIELPVSRFVRGDDDALNVHFFYSAVVPRYLVLLLRGRPVEDDRAASSFIALEVAHRRLFLRARFRGDYRTAEGYPLAGHVTQVTHRYDEAELPAAEEPVEVSVTLGREYLTVRVNQHSEYFYFVSGTVELSLDRLPDDLVTGTLFLGGLPPELWPSVTASTVTVGRSHLRGCISQLTVGGQSVRYDRLVALHSSLSVDWKVSSDCRLPGYVTCSDLHCPLHSQCVHLPDTNAFCGCASPSLAGADCLEPPDIGYYCGSTGLQAGVYSLDVDVDTWAEERPADEDRISFAVLTRYGEGTLFRVDLLVGYVSYLEVRQQGGRLSLDYVNARRDSNASFLLPPDATLSPESFTEVRLRLQVDRLTVSLYSRSGFVQLPSFSLPGVELFGSTKCRITLCGRLSGSGSASSSVSSPFTGVLTGLTWNSVDVFEFGRSSATKRRLIGDVAEVHSPYQVSSWPCHSIFASPNSCEALDKDVTTRRSRAVGDQWVGWGGEFFAHADVGAVAAAQSDVEQLQHLSASTVVAMATASALLLLGVALGHLFIVLLTPAAAEDIPEVDFPHAVFHAPPPSASTGADSGLNLSASAAYHSAETTEVAATAVVHVPAPVPLPIAYQYPCPYPYPYPYQMYAVQIGERTPTVIRGASNAMQITEIENASSSDARYSAGGDWRSLPVQLQSTVPTPALSQRFTSRGIETVLDASSRTLGHTDLSSQAHQAWKLRSEMDDSQPSGPLVLGDEGQKVSCFVLTSDSRFFITGSSSGLPHCWSLQHGELVRVFEDGAYAECLACTTNLHLACSDSLLVGEVLVDSLYTNVPLPPAVGCRRLQVWRTADGSPVPTSCHIFCTASCMLNDGHVVAAGAIDADKSQLRLCLWDLSRDQPVEQLTVPLGAAVAAEDCRVARIKMSIDDDYCILALATRNSDENFGPTVFFSVNVQSLDQVSARSIKFDCRSDCFLPIDDSRCIVGTRQGQLIVWSVPTGRVMGRVTVKLDATPVSVSVPDAEAWAEAGAEVEVEVHSTPVSCLSQSRDRLLMASGDATGNVKVWRFDEDGPVSVPRLLYSMDAHRGMVTHCSFTNDNELLVTASLDGSIRVWKTCDGVQTSWFTSNVSILSVQVSEDKRAIVALGEKNQRRKVLMLQIVRTVVSRRANPPCQLPDADAVAVAVAGADADADADAAAVVPVQEQSTQGHENV